MDSAALAMSVPAMTTLTLLPIPMLIIVLMAMRYVHNMCNVTADCITTTGGYECTHKAPYWEGDGMD